jgi:hypothetical protein
MKKVLGVMMTSVILTGLLAGISGCALSQDNAQFTVLVSGPPGAEFTGSYSCEVKDLIGTRTVGGEVAGTFTTGETTFEYLIKGTEISGKITNKTPDKPITIVLLKDGVEVRRIDGLEAGEATLAWYPPMTIDTKAQEAKGYQYEPSETPGNVIETGYFTDEEKSKIAGLVEKISPETKLEFESQYQNLTTAVNDPAYALRSDPFWETTEPFQQILSFYEDKGDQILPLIFQRLEGNDTLVNNSLGSLMADMALQKHPDVLEKINDEDQHGRYTEDGDYILPYSGVTMRLAKALLAEL